MSARRARRPPRSRCGAGVGPPAAAPSRRRRFWPPGTVGGRLVPMSEWLAMAFSDRSDAGRQLGEELAALRGQDVVVLGLPRGGVPVAFEVARALGAPL